MEEREPYPIEGIEWHLGSPCSRLGIDTPRGVTRRRAKPCSGSPHSARSGSDKRWGKATASKSMRVASGASRMRYFELPTHPRPGWRNWQTQRTQNPPIARSWGFDPPSRHQQNKRVIGKRSSLSGGRFLLVAVVMAVGVLTPCTLNPRTRQNASARHLGPVTRPWIALVCRGNRLQGWKTTLKHSSPKARCLP